MFARRAALATLAVTFLASPALAVSASRDRIAGPDGRTEAPTKKSRTVDRSKFLWATVNVCDTEASPDTIGVRGSMPGARDGREDMFMRFQVEYFSPRDGAWHQVRDGGDSGFVRVGKARYESRQGGRSFRITPQGPEVLLRGVVTFEWRLKGEVQRRARKRTTADRKPSAGSDPSGYSESNCTIKQ